MFLSFKDKWSLSGIQQSCLSIGVIWLNFLDLVTMQAAKFWIACILLILVTEVFDHMLEQENILPKTKPLIMVISKSLLNACLARFLWVRLDIQDDTVLTVWSLKVSWSSKITPRSPAQWVGTRSSQSKDQLAIIWQLPNSISLIFDALRSRWLSKHQFLILVSSLFMSSTTDACCWTGILSIGWQMIFR